MGLKWKIALVGAGNMAQEHARAFVSTGVVEIVGVCGRSRERAQVLAERYGTRAFDDIASMYESTRADAVIVAVNELSMHAVYPECFRHGWLCLVEKPIGLDLDQARQIHAAALRYNARCYVALNRRAYSATREALRYLDGDAGPRLISVQDQQNMAFARSVGQPEEVVRNFMFANSIHLVDYLTLFGRGEIVAVDVPVPWNPVEPRFVVATIRYSSGDVGLYQAVWDGPGPWSVSVTNPQVRVELRPLERLSVQKSGERRLTEVPADPFDAEFKPGLRFQAEQVLRALEDAPTSLATLDEAMRSMALCGAIYGQDRK
jgi:predicted dehydrogenase